MARQAPFLHALLALLATLASRTGPGQTVVCNGERAFALSAGTLISDGLIQGQKWLSNRHVQYTKHPKTLIDAVLNLKYEDLSGGKSFIYSVDTKVSYPFAARPAERVLGWGPSTLVGRTPIILPDGSTGPSEAAEIIDLPTGTRRPWPYGVIVAEADFGPSSVFVTVSEQRVFLVRPDAPPVQLPLQISNAHRVSGWRHSKRWLVLSVTHPGASSVEYRLDLQSGKLQKGRIDDTRAEIEPFPLVQVEPGSADLNQPDQLVIQELQLPDAQTAGILVRLAANLPSEPGSASLNSECTKLIFTAGFSLMIAEIKPVSLDAMRQAATEATRRQLMREAKEIAIGFLIFAADNDDKLPPSDETWRSKIAPYVKNPSTLDKFNYTFKGGALTELNDVSNQEIGSRAGPGGRAVAYADGRVRWVSDK